MCGEMPCRPAAGGGAAVFAALVTVLLRFEAGALFFEFFRARFELVGGGVISLTVPLLASSTGLFAGAGFSAEAGAGGFIAVFAATGDGVASAGLFLLLRGAAEGEKNAAIDACFFYTTGTKTTQYELLVTIHSTRTTRSAPHEPRP